MYWFFFYSFIISCIFSGVRVCMYGLEVRDSAKGSELYSHWAGLYICIYLASGNSWICIIRTASVPLCVCVCVRVRVCVWFACLFFFSSLLPIMPNSMQIDALFSFSFSGVKFMQEFFRPPRAPQQIALFKRRAHPHAAGWWNVYFASLAPVMLLFSFLLTMQRRSYSTYTSPRRSINPRDCLAYTHKLFGFPLWIFSKVTEVNIEAVMDVLAAHGVEASQIYHQAYKNTHGNPPVTHAINPSHR